MMKSTMEEKKKIFFFPPNPLNNQRSLTIVREMGIPYIFSQMVVCISVGSGLQAYVQYWHGYQLSYQRPYQASMTWGNTLHQDNTRLQFYCSPLLIPLVGQNFTKIRYETQNPRMCQKKSSNWQKRIISEPQKPFLL